jgi:hypothetical protein
LREKQIQTEQFFSKYRLGIFQQIFGHTMRALINYLGALSMRRTIGHAEQLAAKLRTLPEVNIKGREISKQEEIKLLAADIQALIRERNWTIQQVAEYLTAQGLAIGTPTLKCYLQRSKARVKANAKNRKSRPQPKSNSTSSSANGLPTTEPTVAQLSIGKRQTPEALTSLLKSDRSKI